MGARETQVTSTTTPPVTLAVAEHGPREAEVHLLLLHGYPDDRSLWDGVVAALPHDWHVVTMDNRGAGRSSRPSQTSAYAVAELVEDVAAVVTATVPDGAPLHLAGHDWGAVVGWEVLAAATWDPRLDQLASFTAVSGLSLDHLRTRASTWRGRWELRAQLRHSWYVALFRTPGLPELLWGRGQRVMRAVTRRIDPTSEQLPWGGGLARDATSGLGLYRALRRGPTSYWRTSVPVLVVGGRHDAFITLAAQDGLEARCRDLVRVALDTGHWIPRSEPRRLAGLLEEHVTTARGRAPARPPTR